MSHPQISLQPDQALLLLNTVFLPTLQREQATTRKVMEAIPASGSDYRPDPVSKTALELAWHIAAADKRFLEGIMNSTFNFDPINRPETVKNAADIARWYGEMIDGVLGRLQKMSGEQLCRVLDFRGMFQLPAVMFFTITLNHSIHHRGQLSTYVRPAGGEVPAIYGESYASAEARKAAESAKAS
jgi:uncharacterized damage-inducible protein DinB